MLLRGYERATPRLLLALWVALAGVVLIVRPADGWALPAGHGLGVVLSLASAALQAAVVLANARMPAGLSPVTASAWGMTAAALCMALLVLPQGITWPQGAAAWLGVLYTGVVTTSVAYLLFAWGARRLSPTAAGLGILVEPLATALLAAWLLAQRSPQGTSNPLAAAAPSETTTVETLPEEARTLIRESEDLYARIQRLDKKLAHASEMHSPALDLRARLEQAF